MDLILAATTYATIAGLVCNFKQERNNQRDLTHEQFVAWLDERKREDLKEFILRSQEIPNEIQTLLKEDTEAILVRMKELRDSLAELPTSIRDIARSIETTRARSDRISLLFQLIAEAERDAQLWEHRGMFVIRNSAKTVWRVPIDVESLVNACTEFKNMVIRDSEQFSFVTKQSALEVIKDVVTCTNRLAAKTALVRGLEKLIALRKELDYLESSTRTKME